MLKITKYNDWLFKITAAVSNRIVHNVNKAPTYNC